MDSRWRLRGGVRVASKIGSTANPSTARNYVFLLRISRQPEAADEKGIDFFEENILRKRPLIPSTE